MLGLLLPLLGFALLDSLNVLNLGVTSAVVYDSRLRRRSALPGGLSFVAGVFAATTSFGVLTVLGMSFLAGRVDFDVTPTMRYWGQLVLGRGLDRRREPLRLGAPHPAALGAEPDPPQSVAVRDRRDWSSGSGRRRRPCPYLTTLAMVSARHPLPTLWPLIVVVYCALALLPSLLVLALSTQRTIRARRVQRTIVRVTTRYGPTTVRILFLGIGMVLVVGALLNYRALW